MSGGVRCQVLCWGLRTQDGSQLLCYHRTRSLDTIICMLLNPIRHSYAMQYVAWGSSGPCYYPNVWPLPHPQPVEPMSSPPVNHRSIGTMYGTSPTLPEHNNAALARHQNTPLRGQAVAGENYLNASQVGAKRLRHLLTLTSLRKMVSCSRGSSYTRILENTFHRYVPGTAISRFGLDPIDWMRGERSRILDPAAWR